MPHLQDLKTGPAQMMGTLSDWVGTALGTKNSGVFVTQVYMSELWLKSSGKRMVHNHWLLSNL